MTILPWLSFYSNTNNAMMIWDYNGRNKYNKSNNNQINIINQTVPNEVSEYFCSKLAYDVISTKLCSFLI